MYPTRNNYELLVTINTVCKWGFRLIITVLACIYLSVLYSHMQSDCTEALNLEIIGAPKSYVLSVWGKYDEKTNSVDLGFGKQFYDDDDEFSHLIVNVPGYSVYKQDITNKIGEADFELKNAVVHFGKASGINVVSILYKYEGKAYVEIYSLGNLCKVLLVFIILLVALGVMISVKLYKQLKNARYLYKIQAR